ncbi:DUF397 domain-containing protein [Actinomadura craniellae]|uniref:DUF397 domain-containing protein n=1 Tax=Actinomadura craniellae TaxID=2231787 RepID=A0A365H3I7_9ACTN|nr:DUF397 domain-containing protein [Actinomadura craniellae]RAY13586.1 DUF397 domain-containing protein [Actinomadura craniellae]
MDLTGAIWRKSTRSGTNGGACIEVANLTGTIAANWHKSTHSGTNGGNCVEVADLPGTIAVRDSKDPHGPHLTLTPAAFSALVHQIKHNEPTC